MVFVWSIDITCYIAVAGDTLKLLTVLHTERAVKSAALGFDTFKGVVNDF